MPARILLACAIALFCAAPAHAGTVVTVQNDFSTDFTYTAANGETNAMHVLQDGSGYTEITDDNHNPVTLTNGGCGQTNAYTVTCGTLTNVRFFLGDGADTFNEDSDVPFGVGVDGGPGNDTITADGTLVGGGGDDEIDGGDSFDIIIGGSGNDTLSGNGNQDTISGGDGNDSLYGGGDDDDLDGGSGVDYIQPDDGNDRVYAQDGTQDEISCDSSDTVVGDTNEDASGCTVTQADNLLTNPGAENGVGTTVLADHQTPPGWTVLSGNPTAGQRGLIAGLPSGSDASAYLKSSTVWNQPRFGNAFVGGPGTGSSGLQQIVSVAQYAGDIDNHFDVAHVSEDGSTRALTLVFQDGTHGTISTATPLAGGSVGSSSCASETLACPQAVRIPAGTRFIAYQLTFNSQAGDPANYISQWSDNEVLNVKKEPAPPAPTTTAVTKVTATSATLNGSVDPGPNDTTVSFDYGVGKFDTHAAAGTITGGGGAKAVTADVTGLTPATTYQVRVSATSAGGSATGDTVTFTTPVAGGGSGPLAPTVALENPSGSTAHTITLRGGVNGNGLNTTYQFQYGPTTAYGSTSTLESTTGFVEVAADLSSLSAGTEYHYRLVAQNSSGTTNSDDATFSTPNGAHPPHVVDSTVAASSVTGTTATITWSNQTGTAGSGGTGNVNASSGGIDYGLTTDFGTRKAGVVVSQPDWKATLIDLEPGTVYHYRVYAVNTDGTNYSASHIFITSVVETPTTVKGGPGGATVPLECKEKKSKCEGKATLEIPAGPVKGTSRAFAVAAAKTPLVLGTSKFSIPAGKSGKVKVHFSKAGRKRLKHVKKIKAVLAVKFTSGGQTVTDIRPVTLKLRG